MEIISDENNSEIKTLENNYRLNSNEFLASGKGSRCEISSNGVIWRLGSLSFAKWLNDKEFWLHSGSALYCSEDNRTIVFSTRSSTATFSGEGTIIIETLENGGFKFIPLEARGILTTQNGKVQKVKDGRMLLVLNTPSYFGDSYDLDLLLLLKSSRLINAYPTPLPTFDQIGLAIYVQQLKLKGKFDALIGDAPTNEKLEVWAFGKNVPNGSTKLEPKTKPKTSGFWNRLFRKD
jgi:hypothetical protein